MNFLKEPAKELYYPIKRGEFDKLFEGLSEIFYLFKKEGIWEDILTVVSLPNSISSEFIKHMVNLICNGACDEYFNYVVEFEYLQVINSTNKLSDFDLAEIVVVKQSIIYLRYLDVNAFFNLLNTLCSRDLSSKMRENFKEVFDNFVC